MIGALLLVYQVVGIIIAMCLVHGADTVRRVPFYVNIKPDKFSEKCPFDDALHCSRCNWTWLGLSENCSANCCCYLHSQSWRHRFQHHWFGNWDPLLQRGVVVQGAGEGGALQDHQR